MQVYVKEYNQTVNFPDGTSQEEMSAALSKNYPTKEKETPTWVKVADFLTGHFPYKEQQGENELINGKPNPVLPGTAKMPLLQDPVTALAFGGVQGVKTAGGLVKKALSAGRETVGQLTGGATEIPALTKDIVRGTKGLVQKTPEPIVSDSIIAEVKGGNVGELPKYAEGSSINLEKLNTTNDVKQFLNQRTKEIEKTIGKRTQTWEETRAMAEGLGWDTKSIEKEWQRKGSFNAAEIEATRQTNINAISELQQAIKDIPYDQKTLPSELRAKVLDTMKLVKVTSQAASEAGRALNIHRKALLNDPEFRTTSEFNKALNAIAGKGGKRTDDLINKMREIDFSDPAQVNRFVYDATKTKWEKLSDGAFELWINGLLSNPLTHIVNTTSNALTMAYAVPERALATAIDALRSTLPKQSREIFAGEIKQEVFAFSKSMQDAVSRFGNAMKKGDSATKFDYRPSALPDKLSKFMPTRAMTAEDAFFKGFIENSELNRMAYREAAKQKLTGQELKDKITDLLAHPTESMLESATKRGQYLTYQKELGSVGNSVFKLREIVPGLKYFIPFVKTPTNIAKFALERTPLNLPIVASKAMRGELKGAALSEELAKPLMGTILGATTYQLAENGYITGGTPKNKNERDEKLATGWQPYSIKIGDKYYSYARLEPLGSILGMAADMSQIKKQMSEDEKYNVGVGVLGSITTNISNKTFMQGFSNIINAISDPGRYGQNAIKNLSGTAIPSISAGVARSTDPYFRDTKSIENTLKARVPYASESLVPKLTVWGEPMERQGSPVSRFLSPVQVSKEKGSPVEKELLKLELDINYPSRKINGVELSPEEYWGMVRSGSQPAKVILDKMVQSQSWNKKTDEQKEHDIKYVLDMYRNKAHKQMVVKLYREGRLKATTDKEKKYLLSQLR